jgi:hypothetical protein
LNNTGGKFFDYFVCKQALLGQLGKNIFRLLCSDNPARKYFDYSVFKIIDCIYGVDYGLPRSRARRRALAQTIGNTRGLDINSPRSMEAHTQDLRFRRHPQRDDPNNARGLDNSFTSDRDCDSTTTT